jgi:hypothetical protein
MTNDVPTVDTNSFGIPGLPERILQTYARLWQLEIWLRRMVYIELRALAGDDWEARILGASAKPKEADKRLSHMPTPEVDPLSYLQLSSVCQTIDANWDLFKGYLPPQSLWKAKVEEISQIRHRVAHFRVGHHDDLARVIQLLRDVDQGFWTFCTSYNDAQPVLPQSDDPVVSHFLEYDLIPWGEIEPGKWARVGSADPDAPLTMVVEVLRRRWAKWAVPVAGNEGLLYDVTIHARSNRHIGYTQLLNSTLNLHGHFAHICLEDFAKSIRVTVPAILGREKIIKLIEHLHEKVLNALVPGFFDRPGSAQKLANEWPEYMIGPDNPLTFLGSHMPCSFFAAAP